MRGAMGVSRFRRLSAHWTLGACATVAGLGCAPATEPKEAAVESPTEQSSALQGENLGGANLGGVNLGGTNLGGSNLGGTNLGGTNLGGNNLGGNNLGGTNLGGTNLGGTNLGGTNLAGTNLGGSNLGGSNLGGTNLGGNNLGGTNLGGTNLGGANAGSNIHNLSGSINGMLYSGEDMWLPKTGQCIVMGIGSTAFSKLLGQQSANARIEVALGKLPWGFASTSGGAQTLNAWEATVWGDQTYCTFVLAAPPGTAWSGVAGFIKAVFRWNAPPTQSVDISGIPASAPYDSTVSTTIATYTGMMDTASKLRAGTILASDYLAGELAFVTATTNNVSVMVDFSAWMRDKNKNGIVLGNVQSTSPPNYAEAMYSVVDNGDGTVGIRISDAAFWGYGGVPASMINSTSDLDAAYQAYQAGHGAKPVPRRCAGALFLNQYYGEPVPAGKCDNGVGWSDIYCDSGAQAWSAASGTTAPMNSYMRMTAPGGAWGLSVDGTCNTKPVLSQTYIHMWSPSYDLPTSGYEAEASGNTRAGTAANASCSGCSGGSKVKYIGNGAANYVTINNVNVAAAGNYELTVKGMATPARTFSVSVNGGADKTVSVASADWNTPASATTTIALNAGNNTIKFHNDTAYAPDLDSISVNTSACTPTTCAAQGKNCGSISNGCGGTIACGSCTSPQSCGGGGTVNVCGSGTSATSVDDSVMGTGTNQLNYSGGGWGHCTDCADVSMYNNSNSWDSTANDFVTMSFTGTQIALYGVKDTINGIGAVSIDGGAETNVDFYGSTRNGNQLLWTSPSLASGSHSFKLRVTHTKNASSSDYFVTPDRLYVTSGGGASSAYLSGGTISSNNAGTSPEDVTKAFDNNVGTKWFAGSGGTTAWAVDQFSTAKTVTSYKIGSANDAPDRDPKSWKLEGSNDGTTWTMLDTQGPRTCDINGPWARSTLTSAYNISNTTAYTRYRFTVTASCGSPDFQVNEIQLFGY